jgi:hypothetical protein
VTALSPAQLYALAVGAGLSPAQATTATAVALAESGGRSDAVGDVGLQNATWGPSVGPWQIRSLKAQYGTGGPRDASRLTDPAFNAQAMAQISGAGANFSPWTTYTSGKFKGFLSKVGATTAADSSGSSSGPSTSGSSGGTSYASTLGGGLFNWQPGVFTIAVKVAGAAAAAALVIVGAVRTVSD